MSGVVPRAHSYVVIELGARYATWAVRAVQALRQFKPDAQYVAIAVEADAVSSKRCAEHCFTNSIKCTVLRKKVGTELSISELLADKASRAGLDWIGLDWIGLDLICTVVRMAPCAWGRRGRCNLLGGQAPSRREPREPALGAPAGKAARR